MPHFLSFAHGSDGTALLPALAAAWYEGAWQQTALAIAGAFLIHLFVRLILLRALNRVASSTDNDLDDRLVYFIRRFYLLFLVFVLALVILKIHGIKITPFLASAGIVGIAIGLAAKETLSGIFLITDQPARIGDRVKIESPGKHWGGWGDVIDVGLRRTQIRSEVLKNISRELAKEGIALASPRVRVETV